MGFTQEEKGQVTNKNWDLINIYQWRLRNRQQWPEIGRFKSYQSTCKTSQDRMTVSRYVAQLPRIGFDNVISVLDIRYRILMNTNEYYRYIWCSYCSRHIIFCFLQTLGFFHENSDSQVTGAQVVLLWSLSKCRTWRLRQICWTSHPMAGCLMMFNYQINEGSPAEISLRVPPHNSATSSTSRVAWTCQKVR